MSTLLEIPPIDFVRELPARGRTWIYAKISDFHDAGLELNCESLEKELDIAHAGIELRTRTGE